MPKSLGDVFDQTDDLYPHFAKRSVVNRLALDLLAQRLCAVDEILKHQELTLSDNTVMHRHNIWMGLHFEAQACFEAVITLDISTFLGSARVILHLRSNDKKHNDGDLAVMVSVKEEEPLTRFIARLACEPALVATYTSPNPPLAI